VLGPNVSLPPGSITQGAPPCASEDAMQIPLIHRSALRSRFVPGSGAAAFAVLVLGLGSAGVVHATPAMGAPTAIELRQDDPKPDKREAVKELCAKYKAHLKERGKEDREAIAVIDLMLKEFPASGPKDRETIAKAIGDAFKERRKPTAEGVADNQLFLAAAHALGECGPESVDVLVPWIGHKDHRDDLPLQRVLILSLGKSKDRTAVEPLTKLLVHHQATVQAAAAEALVNFAHLPLEDRKEIFKEVLDQLTQIKGQIDTDPNNTTERERYDAVRAPMRSTLQVMSKQDFGEPSEWRAWWNNNKNKDWDKIS
jgi:hypothetical protein